MSRIPEIVPVSDLRQDAASVLKRVRKSGDPVFITQRGRASAVILSIDAFKRGEYERRLLHALARGDKEVAAGLGHDLDAVLADADRLLERNDK